jgi:hypothetical protein
MIDEYALCDCSGNHEVRWNVCGRSWNGKRGRSGGFCVLHGNAQIIFVFNFVFKFVLGFSSLAFSEVHLFSPTFFATFGCKSN